MVQLSYPYMTTGKTIALTIRTFVGKVMSLLFNMLSRFVTAFLPRSKCLNFIAAVTVCNDSGAQESKVCHCFHCFPIYFHEVMGLNAIISIFWMLSFKPAFSLSSFTFIKRLCAFYSCSFSTLSHINFSLMSWSNHNHEYTLSPFSSISTIFH